MIKNEYVTPIRIEKIELKNFKGVKNGSIEFNCFKSREDENTKSDILGLYGANGSGKTTLLDALQVVKLAMMGEDIPIKKFGDLISQNEDSSKIVTTFQLKNPDNTFYHIEYSFSLKKEIIYTITKEEYEKRKEAKKKANIAKGVAGAALISSVAAGVLLSPSTAAAMTGSAARVLANQVAKQAGSNRGGISKPKKIEIISLCDESLSLSGNFQNSDVRFGPIFDTNSEEEVFLPKAKHKAFFPKDTALLIQELDKIKKRNTNKPKSFIFSDELNELLVYSGEPSEYANIIFDLKDYAQNKFFVLKNITDDDIYYINTGYGRIEVNKNDSSVYVYDSDDIELLVASIKNLNTVLKTIIPGMSIKAFKTKETDLNEDKTSESKKTKSKILLYSEKGDIRIPLTEESTGILRIVSVLGLISYAFSNSDVTVAIDEIDSGVYECLLGEMLRAYEDKGEGQLIFTCHNLRPLETLDRKDICFTTTNSENRYLKPKNIRKNNNLRDVYIKEIENEKGGQQEKLYDYVKHDTIASAFQKVGDEIID